MKRRAAELVKIWAARGIVVSPLSYDQHSLLLGKLVEQIRWEHLKPTDDWIGEVRAFAGGRDMLTLLDSDVRNEPALLVSASKLLASASNLVDIYPDGLVLIDETMGKALIVEIDDQDGTQFNLSDLPNIEA